MLEAARLLLPHPMEWKRRSGEAEGEEDSSRSASMVKGLMTTYGCEVYNYYGAFVYLVTGGEYVVIVGF